MRELLKKTWFRYCLNLALIVLLYAVLMTVEGSGIIKKYYMLLLIPVGYNIILTASLNLSAGFLGQLPLGHAGFMSIGAYTAALVTLHMQAPAIIEFPLALMCGGLVAAIFGVLVGLPVLRLNGDYLAIITLGFGEIIRVIILNLEFTGGAFGLKGMPKYTNISTVFICVVVTLFIINTLIKSRHGRAILSIREDEIASAASGINVTRYKVLAFSVSAFFAGIAGGLYAHYLGILDPATFGFNYSIEILVMVVLGGMGSLMGSVVSAGVLTILPEMLRGFDSYRMIMYSLLLIVVMIFKPSGLFGKYDFSLGDSLSKLFTIRKKEKKVKGGN